MNEVLIRKLDKMRELLGLPLIVNSGYRCPVHNKNVGGVSNSQHLFGNAADVKAYRGRQLVGAEELAALAVKVGMDGCGKYSWGVHVDCRDNGKNPGTYQWDMRGR